MGGDESIDHQKSRNTKIEFNGTHSTKNSDKQIKVLMNIKSPKSKSKQNSQPLKNKVHMVNIEALSPKAGMSGNKEFKPKLKAVKIN